MNKFLYSFRRFSAAVLFIIHAVGIIEPAFARNDKRFKRSQTSMIYKHASKLPMPTFINAKDHITAKGNFKYQNKKSVLNTSSSDIGGPAQPEMSSFKSAGADNMVNLFTGDFSYNIPLMDVGGYPVNIFYDGSIGMEQEASWVGLGWNINPGNVTRNMRGIPDDFSGVEKLKQTQIMKPNITWGARLNADFELIGIKGINGTAGLGVSINNYLGPAVDLSIKGSVGLSIASAAGPEKTAALSVGLNLGIDASSRDGLTISPNASLTANVFESARKEQAGVGLRLGTSYNSRSGIKDLQLSGQMSLNRSSEKFNGEPKNDYIAHDNPLGASLVSTSISFAKPSYVPALRTAMTNSAFSGHFQLGAGIWGAYGSGEIEVYKQMSEIANDDTTVDKPMVGYLYSQNAINNDNAIMDFTRLNDNEVTSKTPIISAPQYSYDVFSIQGEGTGGNIRAYRNDLGYVRDNRTGSHDKNISAGADVGFGHFGANFNTINTPTTIGEWKSGNYLRSAIAFSNPQDKENVYFRNPGESSVLNPNQYTRIGGENLVRFKLTGNTTNPSVSAVLEKFDRSGSKISLVNGGEVSAAVPDINERKKRTQVVNFLTADEASIIGLDKTIKSYNDSWGTDGWTYDNNLNFHEYPRSGEFRGSKHISQINVTEANGKRYIYGIPVYNTIQKDFTFSVNAGPDPYLNDKVSFSSNEASSKSPHVQKNSSVDGYVQITKTPPYSHTFLLSGLLSPDYVDITGDGITEDDLGTAVKFNYTQIDGTHKWRTPVEEGVANFNSGKLTEKKDDKGNISYGERESWYMHSIESKTMIALFKLEGNRMDGKGVGGEFLPKNGNDNTVKLLREIDLYNKADLKKNGLSGAKPIKAVHFEYDYSLCKGTPDYTTNSPDNGKLTLKRIYFTYNGQSRTNKSQYVFGYENADGSGNPNYQFNGSDRWGTYKPKENNPQTLKNALYPYSTQVKTVADQNAGAWSLKKILLPSGGQIEVTYESDDYAFVQNKRAASMTQIAGFGSSSSPANLSQNLYERNGLNIAENNYVFISIPETITNANLSEIRAKYISGISQLAFKLAVYMPKGIEYINCYAEISNDNYNFDRYDAHTFWIKLKLIDNISPLSLTAVEYLREQLPGQAFIGYDVSESTGLKQAGEILKGLITNIKSAFTNPLQNLRSNGKAQSVDISRSFVRLNNASGYKMGGGQRVKMVKLKDNWQAMTQQYTSEYGKVYDYSTTETLNGLTRSISSGVASYEPSLGSEENPFHTILTVANKLPLGPASYGAIEMPVLDAFFPAPSVGYSKVTVTSLPKIAGGKPLSGIGKQVTQFYTAKDFPVYFSQTSLDPLSDFQAHQSSFGAFFYKSAFDSRALSQGFLVATNDMHGKMRSEASYPQNDDKTPISYTENFYRNTGVNGMAEKFDFVNAADGGTISKGNMGIDIELMTDVREFSVKSSSLEVEGQVDFFPVFFPFWIPFIWPVAGKTENTYRAVTTTKTISYHSIVDSVVVKDKGSQVSTKNLVYDSETGDVIVNRTNNEFNQFAYNTSYPAWWAYSGMGLAYKNINSVYTRNFNNGMISDKPAGVFESGDELLVLQQELAPGDPCASGFDHSNANVLWAYNKNKNISSQTDVLPQFVFMNRFGDLYTRNNVTFKIVRSGKRNMLDAKAATVTSMTSPVVVLNTNPESQRLKIDLSTNAVNASATEYKEKWQTDNDVIKRFSTYSPPIGANRITNGDFETANPNVGSEYVYNNSCDCYNGVEGAEGVYTISTNAQSWFGNFLPCSDHPSGSGKMMIVNGSTRKNAIPVVWSQSVGNLSLHTNYYFSMWFQSIAGVPAAILNIKINGTPISSNSILPSETCTWKNITGIWNSGNSNSAFITIKDLNTGAFGNDFAIDDIFLGEMPYCSQLLVSSCSDTLEKSINPYVKGLLGNFRPAQSKVFYDYRKEADATLATNISKNGVLNNFKLYWDFNASNNLVPDANTSQWIFQSKIVKVNSKGLELETKDANDIHTAAQYGYNKTVPVAIANNSSYNEMFFEGFEDNSYNETLNGAQINTCTAAKQIDFSEMNSNGTAIVEASSVSNLAAHTGKYVLKINSGTSSKTLNVSSSVAENYDLVLNSGVIPGAADMLNSTFSIMANKKMIFSAWIKQDCSGGSCTNKAAIDFGSGNIEFTPSGAVIEGWQRLEGEFTAPANVTVATLKFINTGGQPIYFDDIRIHPYNANMKTYVYDPVNLRLISELDANNYATFYEYDEEGNLIRTKVETKEGVKTLTENRSAKQRAITTIQ